MKDFFDKHGIGVIVVVALLLAGGWYIATRSEQPKQRAGPGFDSTTYYKNLYQQGELNYQFHSRIKEHDTQIKQLKGQLDQEKRRIDGLHGPDLQREVDRQFNQDADRQPQTPPTRSGQNDPVQRGRSAGGPPVPGRGTGEPGHDCPEGLVAVSPNSYDFSAAAGYPVDEQPRPASPKRIGDVHDGFSSDDAKATPFTARKLVVADGHPDRLRPDSRDQVSRNNFRQLILTNGYVYPRIALAISSVETGGWHPSTAIIQQRNLFAMKANRRQNYIGLRFGYAVFATYQASLDDYGQYEQAVIRVYGIRGEQAYIDHICKRFCPAPSYRAKLMKALNGSVVK
ncbi:glucosaminidase domain-containing protein [Fibrella aquatilis]|uniref:Glucosaminidase domain-containing protein n=1 Tax=Fibrella aquatilis TaxID=2817059 RepID=A0A939GBR3_9BACT|nr:glucosaminidase domain-containing protein [Fibrella aquatilis]MBO0933930.1 glucosaminidase domain-containing protein [Fibrella aquatilis]